MMIRPPEPNLDRTFAALSDPTRRDLLAHLRGRDGVSISELAAPFPVSLPAIMKHLDVLADAGVVRSKKIGRVRTYELESRAHGAVERWVTSRRSAMNARFDRLERMLADIRVQEESWRLGREVR